MLSSTMLSKFRKTDRLALKLSVVLLIKIVFLTALWLIFVKDYRVHIDAYSMASHLGSHGD